MPLGEEGKDVRNERLSKEPSVAQPPKATMTSAEAAAQTVLARRSNEQIPLSLGKASLRIRLEAYYSLISPETLSNRTVWLRKYDQIYEKYGGTYQGERKLATKLAKKYGTAVRLLVVTAATEKASHKAKSDPAVTSGGMRDESWYRLRPEQSGSGVVDLLKPEFDPLEALTQVSKEDMIRANPWMEGTSILDNLDKCATLLPEDDPMYRDSHHRLQLRKAITTAAAASKQPGRILQTSLPADNSKSNKEIKKRPRNNQHPFETIASHLDSGPHSFLFRMREERKRIKIVVRYVNMVRGTLTGNIIAFDKHMNMILRDVEEVYSPRLVDEDNSKSNLDLELERRRRIRASKEKESSLSENRGEQHHLPGTWNVRRRQMKQLMVRGDMVVSVYEAEKEKNTGISSRYKKRKVAAANTTTSNDKESTAKRLKGNEDHG